MDYSAILENKFTKAELLCIPKLIDENQILRSLYLSRNQEFIENDPEHFNRKTDWSEKGNRIMNESNLERIWNHLRNDTQIENIEHLCFDTSLDTYFGWMRIYENTITLTLHTSHKYRSLRNPYSSKYIFQFIREVAKLLKSRKIVYCCNGYFHPSIIDEKAMMGWKLGKIIEYGNKIYGKPPKELNAAIENLYFIDEFDLNLEELDPNKKVWSRATYEYEKEKKGEPPYNMR